MQDFSITTGSITAGVFPRAALILVLCSFALLRCGCGRARWFRWLPLALINGNDPGFAAVNLVDIGKSKNFLGSAGNLAAGMDDADYGAQTRTVYTAPRATAMDIQFIALPGGHAFPVGPAVLAASLNWPGTRLGTTA